MNFRVEYTVRELRLELTEGEQLTFRLGGEHELTVSLARSAGHREHSSCWALGTWDPPRQIRSAFEALAQHRLPEGSEPLEGWPWEEYRKADGSFDEKLNLPRGALPEAVRSFMRAVGAELGAAIRRTVGVLRWRCAEAGPHDPFSVARSEWSFDGVMWLSLPKDIRIRAEVIRPLHVTAAEMIDIQRLLTDTVAEPIAHSLFREAWVQRYANPRSALVIGVAAVEVGVKDLACEIVPAATWLNMPSPPVVAILREFLPSLSTVATLGGKPLSPPAQLLEEIAKAVHARNRTVHVKTSPLPGERVEEMLRAVRDVLWLLDCYRGQTWAVEHIREETRRHLVTPAG